MRRDSLLIASRNEEINMFNVNNEFTLTSRIQTSQNKRGLQTIEPYHLREVPAKPGVKPHLRVKELPALPVREHQQDNMLHQQDNMLKDEVVNFGQHVNNNFNFINNITYLTQPGLPKTGYEPEVQVPCLLDSATLVAAQTAHT